jgi:hypothetical protein
MLLYSHCSRECIHTGIVCTLSHLVSLDLIWSDLISYLVFVLPDLYHYESMRRSMMLLLLYICLVMLW